MIKSHNNKILSPEKKDWLFGVNEAKRQHTIQFIARLFEKPKTHEHQVSFISIEIFFFVIFEHAECNNLLLLLLISRFNVWKPLQMVHSATTFLLKTTKAQISRVEYYCTTKTKLEKQKWLLWLFSVLLQQQ